MAANEISCVASEMPWMALVSCTGKKPLGITMYITTVIARVSTATSKVSAW